MDKAKRIGRKDRIRSYQVEKTILVDKSHVELFKVEAARMGTSVKGIMEDCIFDKGVMLLLEKSKLKKT